MPPAPTPPTSFNGGGGSGGGGGGGGGYTPPTFKPFTLDLKSSDGSTIGNITGKSFSLATVWAEKSLGAGSGNVTVRFTADMDSAPSAPKLDITYLNADNLSLPLGQPYHGVLAFNITRSASSGEWPLKSGTAHMTVTVPVEMLNGYDMNSAFYLIKDDSKRMILYTAAPVVNGGMASFDVPLWYESSSPSMTGIYTLAGTKLATAAITTSTPVPTSNPTETPKPSGSSMTSVITLISAVMLATVLYGRKKR